MEKLSLLFTLAVLFFVTSCSNNDNSLESTNLNTADIYVAGKKQGNATYWKNSLEITLDNGGFSNTIASKIVVKNDNIYLLGRNNSSQFFDNTFMFWKNDNLTNLNDLFQESNYEVHYITDMIIDDVDEYFLGYLRSMTNPTTYDLVYWKNGIKTVVIENCVFRHQQSSIKIIDGNIYIFTKNENNDYGIFINNSFNQINSGYLPYGIVVKENEVYAYGSISGTSNTSGFYKNVVTNTETTFDQSIRGLVFDAVDTYTVVYYNNNADFSSRREIKKNNSSYYVTPEGFESHIADLKVINGNVYTIVRELTSGNYGPNKLLINNEEELVLDENPHDVLTSIYILEN